MNELAKEKPSLLDLPALDLKRFSQPPPTTPVGEKYLVFFLGTEFYAVSTRSVVEAHPTMPVTALPNAPNWLLGIANLRGEVISVINLPDLLGQKNFEFAPKPKFIVLRSHVFDSGAALTADRISEIVTLPDAEIKASGGEQRAFITGRAVQKSQTLNLIDAEKLLASLKL